MGSYNPYSTGSGFTPYAGGHTPTGNNSAANTPNPGNGTTPTGFRFSVCPYHFYYNLPRKFAHCHGTKTHKKIWSCFNI